MLAQQYEPLQRLTEITASQRQALLIVYIQEQVAKFIGISASELDIQQPLKYLGIDSIIATKLRNRLRNDLAIDVPAVKFMEDSSIASLVTLVDQKLIVPQSSVPESVEQLPIQSLNEQKKKSNPSSSYPLTYSQQGLWFLYKLAPESASNNIAFTTRIRSNLNVSALRRACQQLIVRHVTLRTTFSQRDAEPFQEVHPYQDVCFQEIDVSILDENELTNNVIERYRRPFDLERGPVLQVDLFTRSQQDYVLLLKIHHIAIDGFSLGIILDELRLLYEAENTGHTVSLAPIQWQYQDFVQWQREMLASPVGDKLWAYWQQQLAGELPVLKLPTDRPRPLIQNYNGASYTFELTQELTAKLRETAKEQGATLYMILLAAFQVLLYRYTAQEDIIVGSPSEGRSQPEFVGTVGFFINMLPLRVNLAGNPTFSRFLSQVRQTVLAAIAHQDYPSPLLIERLQVNRDASLPGLFQAAFNLLKLPEMAPDYELSVSTNARVREDWGGLCLEPWVIPQQEGLYDIFLHMMETKQSLVGILRYDPELFEETTISRMAAHFQTLLAAIVSNPQQKIDLFPLLSNIEKQQLICDWNSTAEDYGFSGGLHQLFETQVERTPEAIALVFEGQELTYRELNFLANQLAHYLQTLGVKPETLVGIFVERSPEMIVGILAILKAGGAYLPLDPNYPRERLEFMLCDSQVLVLITQQEISEKLPASTAKTIYLDLHQDEIAKHSQENPSSPSKANNLAYVIYTSGSTGTPKGVLGTHQGTVNGLHWLWKTYPLAPGEICCQKTAISFVDSVWEIFAPLLKGISNVIIPDEVAKDPQLLIETLSEHKVTRIILVPSLLRLLLDTKTDLARYLSPLKVWITSGEELSVSLAKKFRELMPSAELINFYGSSEVSANVTYYNTSLLPEQATSIPIGRPIDNTSVYVLNKHLQLAPVGVVGELYLSGEGLARGYLHRQEITQERFIDNPFLPGSKLFKTGDLVRYLKDGNLEYLGRCDHQVKIRGFRIELGEIEAVLSTHPQVREVVVIAQEEQAGKKYLVAYIVPHDNSLSNRQLRNFLKQKLPEYMVPAAVVFLEALPLTPNGKINRRALPAPDLEQNREQEFVAPRTPTEEAIANIITSVLAIKQIGIHDNFFELGGNSLLATQVISRLQQTFSVELRLRYLFESPTVAELNALIWSTRQTGLELMIPAIEPVPRDQAMPLSWAQTRLWFLDQLNNHSAIYNMPTAMQINGKLQVAALEQTLAEIVRRHEVLRTSFSLLNDTPVQVIDSTATVSLSVVDLQEFPEEQQSAQVHRLAILEANKPFELNICPLLRVTLLQLGGQSHVLLLTMHHIISDAWSMGVFIQELSTLYPAFLSAEPSPLPELPIQYADFAIWQQQWLSGELYAAKLNYWKQQLAGAPPLLELPTDKVRPPAQSFRGRSSKFEIDLALSKKLKTLSQKSGTTLFMTLLAVFVTLLSRYSGQDDILIGTPIANRNHQQIESLIGFFVNTLVLRIKLKAELSFSELLTLVRQVALEAYEHQDIPFEQVVEALQPERNLSNSPLFQVMFAWQNAPMGTWELPGLTLTTLEIESVTAKFDLTLAMTETEEGLRGWWEYSTDLFEADTISRMEAHFQTLLAAIAVSPELSVSQLPHMLTDRERHQLLVEWNQTEAEYAQSQCIHQLFEAQVERTPEAEAVVFVDEQNAISGKLNSRLTYSQLNSRANQLAHYLQGLGVGPEVLVGICVDRSLEMIVGLLGILKAGGAYVPLDPAYPQERLNFMLSDAQVSLLLTQQNLVASLQWQNAPVVCLDQDWEIIANECDVNLVSTATSQNLAYVVYTSGSTGKSKGVAIAHRSLVNAYQGWENAYQLRSLHSHLQMASFSFDVFSGDLIRALGSGGKLVLCPRQWLLEPEKLYKLMRQEKIDSAEFVPAVLRNLIEYLQTSKQNLHFMGLLVVGSDSLFVQEYEGFKHLCGSDTRLINSYGVSEATVDSTYFENTKLNLPVDGLVPIGRPFANTQIYILDSYLQPVPVGISGELYIGGMGLAREYLNRPDLTEEKFIPNPFGNSKLYKTGDLARYLVDGNIEFLGRIDHQVKIRGFRIELGEVEAVVNTHPQVQEAVVIAREEQAGNKYLAAYLVPHQESPNPRELGNFLKQKLPDYMVPSAFVILEALPLTPNGKIDRQALPIPDIEQNRQTDFVAPSTFTEEVIASIIASVLGIKQVGIYDNFFELGGHSLLATQVISRLRRTFNFEFPLRRLLESPTVEGINQILSQCRQGESLQASFLPLPTIVPAPKQRYQPFPLTDIQQAYWLGRNQAFELGNIAAHGYLELDTNNLNLERLNLVWQQLILRHDMLRAVILPDGQQQILEKVPPYEIEVLDLRTKPPEVISTELEAIREQMSHEVLPAQQWPLFKLRATCLEEQLTRIHLSFDALIGDAWSMFVILREWYQLYQNPELLLPPLELSFRDYVLAELALQNTQQYRSSQEYWFNRLDTLPPGPELPLAINPASITKPQFKRHRAQLSPAQWQQLKDRAKQVNLTPSGVLLGAFAQILSKWSKSQKFIINLTLFKRLSLHPQVNELVGDFTSLTLLEVDNSIPNTFATSAQQLQQQLWQDLDHGYVSGLQVQRELRRRREGYQPMPVVFTSTLGLDSLGDDVWMLDRLGKEVYSISQTPQVWLDHQVREKDGALLFNWDAVEELFPEGLLDDMFAAYCCLLECLATSDSAWVETKPQLLPSAQLQQRSKVNNTTAPISQQTLHRLFIERAQLQPQSLAVITPEDQLTYQQLYQRAAGLAAQLRRLGATANTLVAVVMEKGWEQVVAVLGILISGAAYLPIDPSLPKERQWYLLQQGEVKLVLTQALLKSKLSWPGDVQILGVDQGLESLSETSLHHGNNQDLAYVIFTSGSTGKPKGVAIKHQSAVNTIVDINQRFGVKSCDRVLALSALNFDLSVYDIFGMLAAGGTIVIPSSEAVKDPAHWLELIVKEGVTIWNSVPALMQMLVEHLSARSEITPLSLRLALLSGDWLPLKLPEQIQAYCSNLELVSLGGATEASIWSIYYPITTVNPNWKSIPYGKPLTNQHFYVLNELMEATPIWVPGQLYIGGIGLALDYWGDQDKTNASFITHPVSGERLYKTGDLGRYLPDGNIEFLGREDFQVKIKGYRIELGEIEAALRQHSVIKQAVVAVVGEELNKKQLVAYLVPDQELMSAQTKTEAYQPSQLEGVITDPIERIEFKFKQPGLRQLEPSQASIQLPQPEFDETLTQTYLQRQSYRQFLHQPISLEQLSQFLSCLQQMKLDDYPLPKYLYPSAGSIYAVQSYLLIKPNRVEGLEAGIYYYHPVNHCLVLLSADSKIEGSIYGGNQLLFEQSAFSLFLIGQLNAITPMYGKIARDFCLLEAGHIGQLLMNAAPEQEIGLCPIGYLKFEELRNLFQLESSQVLLYSFVGGKIDLTQTKQWLSSQTTRNSQSISAQLRKYLQQKLPKYMVPSIFMLLESLPLTANGKVDRQALPAPERTPELEKMFVAPRNQVEDLLAKIWTKVFQFKQIGIHDDFFELGGDSFLALQLISKINQKLDTNISLGILFQHPTLAEIAGLIIENTDTSVNSPYLVPIQVKGTQPPLFCIHPVGGQVMVYQHLAACLGLDQPVIALQSRALNNPVQEHNSIDEMAIEYAKAIRHYQPDSPYHLMGWSMGGVIAVSVAKELEQQGQKVAFVGLVDAFLIPEHTLTFERDPLWEIASVFGGSFVDAFMTMDTVKQQSWREQLINLPSIKRLQWMINWGQEQNLLSNDISVEILQKQLNILEIHEQLLRSHRAPQIQAKLHVWWALDRLAEKLPCSDWSQYTTGVAYTEVLGGNHFTVMRPPYIKTLAEKLQICLQGVRPSD
ncbi:MAG: amino acid adenylation domain-containing protein [Symploca sp. SIO1C4]|uniref:Phenyloxazoline synthase MbtB n=1 Tax=Symploca sp. SIO1C4 TaxID=2607765 RepID=A0A6B3N8C2_9CYAN|nr:amino acid adenylation domain-containing protein [Symploca sp. SIO1C4]